MLTNCGAGRSIALAYFYKRAYLPVSGQLQHKNTESTWNVMEISLTQSPVQTEQQTTELDHLQLLQQCPSAAMREVVARVSRYAGRTSNILLRGESGVGKEHVARALHAERSHKPGPFIAVNCSNHERDLFGSAFFGHEKGAFTGAVERQTGHFENANCGTLFLDEISTLPPEQQPKLLRVFEERTIQRLGSARVIPLKFRLIVASNEDLSGLVKAGRFREALYYRLNVLPIQVPPLRERQLDIPHFASYFLHLFSEDSVTLSSDALDALCAHDWPGNVRELRNTIERGLGEVGTGSRLEACHLEFDGIQKLTVAEAQQLPPEAAPSEDPFKKLMNTGCLADIEQLAILRRLERYEGQRTNTAKSLGINVRTLRNKLHEYGVPPLP